VDVASPSRRLRSAPAHRRWSRGARSTYCIDGKDRSHHQIDTGDQPAKVISALNAILCRDARGQYATAVYLYINEANRIIRYSVAEHPPPLLWRGSTRTLHTLNEAGLLLGVRANETYNETELTSVAGDRVLLYTDGLTEAENSAGQSYGDFALKEYIESQQGLAADPFC
jgi:sigma-B regulation protein RsbU (phosphoserine phosphatase)